jgi:PAS domain-containing protein
MRTNTDHALAERADWEDLYDQILSVKSNLSFKDLSGSSSEYILILNTHMQIVFVTRRCLDLLGIEDPAEVYGCRTGEVIQCIYSNRENGCGTTSFCHLCGAAHAILGSLKGDTNTRKFHVTQQHNDQTLALTITTKPIRLSGTRYILLSLATSENEQEQENQPTRLLPGPAAFDRRTAQMIRKAKRHKGSSERN